MNRFLDKLPFQRSTLVKALLIAFVASLAATAAVVQAESKDKKVEAAKPVLTVSLVKPKAIEWAQTVAANGNVVAWQESLIGTEIGGLRLIELNAQVGDWVKKGQVLARYNDETVQAEVAQAKASVAETEAALAEAKQNADRVRQLGNTGAMSEQQMTEAYTKEITAKARVQSAKAQLSSAQVRLGQTKIVAPDDGVISKRDATLGAVSQPGQELFRLVRQGRLEWQAEVTAAESARIKVGQAVSLAVPTGKVLQGTVRKVAPTVDVKTRNVLVYVDIKKDDSMLGEAKPGMFAKGNISVGQGKALALPGSAVLLRDGFANVFVLQAGNKVKQVRVKLGRQADGLMEVEGVAADAQVVASGAGFLADGDVVRVVVK
ncbi:efflux RND transporter periplasmic adaptor subunit [Deefgea rivuli]|uniref:efflux RND transporter periplasmic adaptor subunit n=1 Tax=Deefgea rivuli TaxID=400948 RepID=UPI0006853CA0|nr:efflux RND transporter periplasmic adaptor subunit [Deefgea rivuli]